MSVDDRLRWDAKYAAKQIPQQLAPDAWLQEVTASLKPGRALELACGLGHNAIWLAQQGWQVDAVDVSPVGLQLAANFAHTCGADVNWIATDLDDFTPPAKTYDLICVFRFLDRRRLPLLIETALLPGGLLLYETFNKTHLARSDSQLKNPAFALDPGELPRLFPLLTAVSYTECELPDRNVARLIARRPNATH